MSSDNAYVCTLDNKSVKKAKDELNENAEDRLAAVAALRTWIEEQPHIKCPTHDTMMLLRFLRGAKFSQIRAREMIEANLALKTKAPIWFKDVDSHDKDIVKLINSGYITPLPKRTPDGCKILLYRLGKLRPKDFEAKFLMRAAGVILHYVAQDEMSQVYGIVFFMDFSGVTASHMTKMMSKDMQKWQKLWQKSTPGRFKGFNYYNAGVFMDALLTFARPFLPKKWIDRIKIHDTLETVYKEIPMECLPEEYLPDDYKGPNVGHIDDCIKNFMATIADKKFRDDLMLQTSDAFNVDESKRPTETVTSHFRKLNVD